MPRGPYSRYGSTAITGIQSTARRHTVGGGETVPSIAAAEYGQGYDQELWRQIAEDNAIDDLDALAVGAVLAIYPPRAAVT